MSGRDVTTKKVWVEVCLASGRRQLIGAGGYLEGDPILPGFRYATADLFKEWDWE